jgi:O-antigen/teichoic acid export membrane protein
VPGQTLAAPYSACWWPGRHAATCLLSSGSSAQARPPHDRLAPWKGRPAARLGMSSVMAARLTSKTAARAAPAASTLSVEAVKFSRSAGVYIVGTLLVRGTTVLLTPLYTKAMGPGDFAVVAVANAIGSVLALFFGLDLSGCIPRLSFEYNEEQRRAFFGTLLWLSLTLPMAFVAALYILGTRGDLEFFTSVHFSPHLELVVWSSFFSIFVALPLAVYNTRERPGLAAFLGGAGALSQLTLTLLLVAWLHQGAIGVLRANLLSAALMGVISIGIMVRMSTFSLAMPGLKVALVFSLPVVPHLIANWALAISDRLILDRYVPAADVGRYALGYMFNVIVAMVAAAIGNALKPMAYRQLKDPLAADNVPPLGTYAMLLILGFALTVALLAKEIIAAIAPPSYAGAAVVVPWVVLGAVFQGMYLVLSIGTWFSMRTSSVALVTVASAILNVAMNLLCVPKYGVMAAAGSTAICYGVSAILHGLLAHRLHPIAWEYRRWAVLFGAALLWYLVGTNLPVHGLLLGLVTKTSIVTLAFPISLLGCRFLSQAELTHIRALAMRLRGAR